MQLKLSDRIMKPDFQGEFTASILAAAASPDLISFAGGLPNPISFPIPEMEAATKKVLENNGVTALQYSSTIGWPALRQWIAKRYETMGVRCEPGRHYHHQRLSAGTCHGWCGNDQRRR